MTIGGNIARLRLKRHLTQEQLAEAAGLSSVAMIEAGLRANPRMETLQKIADALEVPISELFVDPADPQPDSGPEEGPA